MKNKLLIAILLLLNSCVLFSQGEHINVGNKSDFNQFIDVMNQFSPKNHPGNATLEQLIWKTADNIYIYGNGNLLNNCESAFWVFNLTLKQWKCIQNIGVNVNFGQKGIFNSINTPGKRKKSITFSDATGNLYLMGGSYPASSQTNAVQFNDLWKYDIILNQWAWIGGYNLIV